MPRPRTGSAFPHGDHFDIQATLPDGTRSRRVCLPPGIAEPEARAEALRLTKLAAKGKAVRVLRKGATGGPGETFAAWFSRYCDVRESHGLTTVDDMRGHGRKWLKSLAEESIADLTRDDIEAWVEWMDEQVRAGALAWKSAANIWGTLTHALDEACNSKVRGLRVRKDSPAAGVRGPDRGATVSKVYLYPSELLHLAACERVAHDWLEIVFVTTYLYLRAAEVRGLNCEDFDLEHRVLHLHRAIDDDGTETTLKGDEARRVQIEPTLVPLLDVLIARHEGKGRLFPNMAPDSSHLAQRLRQCLQWAGVKRAELFASDATRRPVRFHDLRASGITWRAVRGDDPLKIMKAAGHKNFATTQAYIRDVEQVSADFGAVFPPLPPRLAGAPESLPESLPDPEDPSNTPTSQSNSPEGGGTNTSHSTLPRARSSATVRW